MFFEFFFFVCLLGSACKAHAYKIRIVCLTYTQYTASFMYTMHVYTIHMYLFMFMDYVCVCNAIRQAATDIVCVFVQYYKNTNRGDMGKLFEFNVDSFYTPLMCIAKDSSK